MIKAEELERYCRSIWLKPLERPENTFGCSEIPFCLKKLYYKATLEKQGAVNGKMIKGKIFHKGFQEIVDETLYANSKGWKVWEKPKYESLAEFSDPRGFKIQGHCDCDVKAWDRIIELKTSETKMHFTRGDFLTEAYIMQGNAYACIKKRSFWEIWVIYTSFMDLAQQRFVSILEGPADMELFNRFLERVYNVFLAIKNKNEDIVGPEQGWECKNCSFLRDCKNWRELIPKFEAMLPADKKTLCAKHEMENIFDILYDRGEIKYSRDIKMYESYDPLHEQEI